MAFSNVLKRFVCCMHRVAGRVSRLTPGDSLTTVILLPSPLHASSYLTSVRYSSQSRCQRSYCQALYPCSEKRNQAKLPVLYSHISCKCAGESSVLKCTCTSQVPSRSFKTKVNTSIEEETDRVMTQLKHEEGVLEDNSGWLIRLSNENNYLSWCRNVYIATIAGATIYGQFVVIPHSKEAGVVLLMMGGINLLSGTGSFLYNLVHLRHKMMMHRLTVILHTASAVLHMVLWLGCMAIYIGYVEADEDEIDDNNTEGFKNI